VITMHRMRGCGTLLAALARLAAFSIFVFAMRNPAAQAQAGGSLTVSAAASLKDAIGDVETAYKRSHANTEFANNFGSSGTLAAQIDQGAPADVFLSAAAKPMDDLEAEGIDGCGHAPQPAAQLAGADCSAQIRAAWIFRG
jgi:ABC-type molybdate transport system substrate-binding protein